MDSFAGSGTTAHAILFANSQDGGKRKFILVEMEDYADTLTAERVRRLMKGVPGAKDEALRVGLGGAFTYCDLGEPMDTERFFSPGAALAYEQVARYVIYTATGETVSAPAEPTTDWFVAEAAGRRVHVIYRSDLAFLRSNASALTLDLAREIAAAAEGGPTLVFGAAQFVNSRTLRDLGITFAQLPWSVHQRLAETDGGARA